MSKYLSSMAAAVLATAFISYVPAFAEDAPAAAAPAPAAVTAPAPAAAPAAAVAPAAPADANAAAVPAAAKKKVVKKKKAKAKKPAVVPQVQAGSSTTAIEAAVKLASSPLSVRLAAIELKLDQIPAQTVKLAGAPYPENLAVQMQKIRIALTDYGTSHREAMATIAAGHIIRNMTWITGGALALAGYSSVHKMDHPQVNDYRLCIVGGGIIGGGQIIAGICDIVGMTKEGNAAAALQRLMEAASEYPAPAPAQ